MPLRNARRRWIVEPRAGFRAVGRVERPWSLHGDLKVEPLTDFPKRFEAGARLYLDGAPRTVVASRWQKGRVYLRLEGIESIEAAEPMRGELLEVPETERPAFQTGEYLVDEIVGCAVRTAEGDDLGAVLEVLHPGANDVYVVKRPGKRDLLVPAITDVVREVDIAAKAIVVDLPEGLDPESALD